MTSIFRKLIGGSSNKSDLITINERFYKIIDVDQSQHRTLNLSDDSKILVIKSCNTINKLFEVLNEKEMKLFLDDSSHCFIVSSEFSRPGSTGLTEFLEGLNKIQFKSRPLIIELFNADHCWIFYKNYDEDKFKACELGDCKEKIEEEKMKSMDFNFLLKILNGSEFGSFKGKIMNCKINIVKEFKGKTLMEFAVESGDALVVRFLKLFFVKAPNKELLRKAVHFPKTLSALLNLNMIDNDHEARLEPKLEEQLRAEFKNDKNLLITAAEDGDIEVLKCVIKLNLWSHTFEDALKASNAAMDNEKYENLLVLLLHDFPFPTDFEDILDNTDDETLEKLKELHDERKKVHAAIDRRDLKEVQKFLEKYPDSYICYSPDNVSAKRAAFDAYNQVPLIEKDYKVYASFLCHGFTAHKDSECHKDSDPKTKKLITEMCKDFYGKDVDSHIFFIFSKCRLGHYYDYQTKKGHLATIKSHLDDLNEIPLIKTILKAVEHSYSLCIVFDFKRDSIERINLTQTATTLGVCCLKSGRLYIGAKSSTAEVLGTMIHELTHFAMQLVFNNNGNPFYSNDHEKRNEFQIIVDECKAKRLENDPIVQKVFSKGNYKPDKYSAELIVRIPEMLVFHKTNDASISDNNEPSIRPNIENDLLKKYEKLWKFYLNEIDIKIEVLLKNPQYFETIQNFKQWNDQLANIRDFQSLKIHAVDPGFELSNPNIYVKIIVSDIPQLTIHSLIQSFKNFEYIVLTTKNYAEETDMKLVQSILLQKVKFTMIAMITSEDTKFVREAVEKLLKKIKVSTRNLIFVCDHLDAVSYIKEKMMAHKLEQMIIKNYDWNDFSEEMKTKILQKEVNFQGARLKLCNLIDDNSEAAKYLPLPQIFKEKIMSVGKNLQSSSGYDSLYFIPRLFTNSNLKLDSVNFESFLVESSEQKLVLISDDAGMGKSTILTHAMYRLKELHPDHWVLRVDLNKQIAFFKKAPSDVTSILCEYFEGSKNKFEFNLMSDLLSEEKVILMLDGLDEIYPFYNAAFEQLLDVLKASEIKQIWITTRPHLRADLEKQHKISSWEMEKFTKIDQENFLVKFWKSKLECSEMENLEQRLQEYAEELVALVTRITLDTRFDFIGVPLQAQMLAEVFREQINLNLKAETTAFKVPAHFNLLWLYEKFIKSKITIALKDKGELVIDEEAENKIKRNDVIEDHQKLAIRILLFEENLYKFEEGLKVVNELDSQLKKCFTIDTDELNFSNSLHELRSDLTCNELQRYGLVTFDRHKDRAAFIHRTYAEYFVASYIYDMILKSKSYAALIPDAVKMIGMFTATSFSGNKVIAEFLNISLSDFTKLQNIAEIRTEAAKCYKHYSLSHHYTSLVMLVHQDQCVILNFILFCSSYNKQNFSQLLYRNDSDSILNASLSNRNEEMMLSILKYMEEYLTEKQIQEFFDKNDCHILKKAYLRTPVNEDHLQQECFTVEELKNSTINEITFDVYNEHSMITLLFEFTRKFYGDSSHVLKLLDFDPKTEQSSDHKSNFLLNFPNAKEDFQIFLNHRWRILLAAASPATKEETLIKLFTNMTVVNSQFEFESFNQINLHIFKWFHEKFPSFGLELLCPDWLLLTMQKLTSIEVISEIANLVKEIIKQPFYQDQDVNMINLIELCSDIDNNVRLEKLMDQKYPENTNFIASLLINPDVQAETLNFLFVTIPELLNPDEYFSVLQASTYNEELLIDLTIDHASLEKIRILLSYMELLSSEKLQQLISQNILGSSRFQQDPKVRELLMKQIERVYTSQSITELLSKIDPKTLHYSIISWEKYDPKHSVDDKHEVSYSFDPRWNFVQKLFNVKTKQGMVNIERFSRNFYQIIYYRNKSNHSVRSNNSVDRKLLSAFNNSKAMKIFAEKHLLNSLRKVTTKGSERMKSRATRPRKLSVFGLKRFG